MGDRERGPARWVASMIDVEADEGVGALELHALDLLGWPSAGPRPTARSAGSCANRMVLNSLSWVYR